jgi:Tol biopolymer transport system component
LEAGVRCSRDVTAVIGSWLFLFFQIFPNANMSIMRTACEKASAPSSAFFLFNVMLLAVTAAAVVARGSDLPPSSAKAISVTEATHDGISKINLLSDDSHLYLTESQGAQVIAKISLESSNRSVIATPFSNVRVLDLSPDGTKLLVSAIQAGSDDNEFWSLPVVAGSPERVGDLTGRDAAWSSDGKQIVFSKRSVVFLASSKGKQASELFTASGSVFAPRFSPDGQRIRFTVSNSDQNTTTLWEVGRDGSSPHPLLPNWQLASTACCGKWSADGRYYIFQVTQKVLYTDTTITSLWAISDSGSRIEEQAPVPVPLTTGPMSFGSASPARDNKNIWAIGVRPAGEVVKYDLAKKEFVPVAGGFSATDVDFSTDGKWLTYVALPEGTLWRCRADGTERLQLTVGPELAALPRWSPDGSQIAYVSMQPGRLGKISIIAADGGTSHEILPGIGSQIDANWSPDGTRIMFGDFAHDTQGLGIQILDLSTHKIEVVPDSEGLFSPRWSPNGRYVAALSRDNTALKLFDFKNQKWSDWLITAAGTVNYPVWSADSKYIYFDDFVNNDESIRRVKLSERKSDRVFVLGQIERYVGAFGPWSGRTSDGSWMFVRDRSTQEAYQLSVQLP